MKSLSDVILILKGGKGSGDFGHKGRPGKRGGSASYGSSGYSAYIPGMVSKFDPLNGPIANLAVTMMSYGFKTDESSGGSSDDMLDNAFVSFTGNVSDIKKLRSISKNAWNMADAGTGKPPKLSGQGKLSVIIEPKNATELDNSQVTSISETLSNKIKNNLKKVRNDVTLAWMDKSGNVVSGGTKITIDKDFKYDWEKKKPKVPRRLQSSHRKFVEAMSKAKYEGDPFHFVKEIGEPVILEDGTKIPRKHFFDLVEII